MQGCLLEVAVKEIGRERLCGKWVLISQLKAEVVVVNEREDLLLILKWWNAQGFEGEEDEKDNGFTKVKKVKNWSMLKISVLVVVHSSFHIAKNKRIKSSTLTEILKENPLSYSVTNLQ